MSVAPEIMVVLFSPLWWKIMLVWCKIARRGMVLLHFCLRGRGWYYFTVVWGEGMVLLRRCLGERDGITPLLSWGRGEERGGRQAGWRATRKVALASLNDRRFSDQFIRCTGLIFFHSISALHMYLSLVCTLCHKNPKSKITRAIQQFYLRKTKDPVNIHLLVRLYPREVLHFGNRCIRSNFVFFLHFTLK